MKNLCSICKSQPYFIYGVCFVLCIPLILIITGLIYSCIKHCQSMPSITLGILLTQLSINQWQQLANILYGSLALMLGFLYFYLKIIHENETSRKNRVRGRLKFIYEQLVQAGDQIKLIIDCNFESDAELDIAREKLHKHFMLMNDFIESSEKLLAFTNEELSRILSLHSFLDNSRSLFENNLAALKQSTHLMQEHEYIYFLQEARTVCLQKIEEI